MKRTSTKTAARNRRYARERIAFLTEHPLCGSRLEDCAGLATQVHHMAGRWPSVFFRHDLWLAVCGPCHRWITEHPADSRRLGLSTHRGAA